MAFFNKVKQRVLSRRVLFSALAIVLIAGLSAFVIYAVTFIAQNLKTAIAPGSGNTPVERFDIKGFEALKLQKP